MRAAIVAMLVLLAGCSTPDSERGPDPGPPIVEAQDGVGLVKVVDTEAGLLHATHAHDGSGQLYLVHQAGLIQLLADGDRSLFGDLSDRVNAGSSEQGLLSIAFAPDHGATGRLYAAYTASDGATVVSRFTVAEDGGLDPASEEILLDISQPFSNHNGGHILFGPDNMLYVSLGDGGAAGDPMANGQNRATLLGSILRIDVSGQSGYAVPPENPYVGDPSGADEIWAYGLRNVWRMSFDHDGNDTFLWTADVGQNAWEEVNRAPARMGGINYGWNLYEGSRQYPSGASVAQVPSMHFPITEYDHDAGCSVTGGYVYRGEAVPDLQGKYVFGDYCSGTIWTIDANATQPVEPEVLLETELRISSFAQDEAGELYVLHHGGTLYRFAPEPAQDP